jgi:hypothetical protein
MMQVKSRRYRKVDEGRVAAATTAPFCLPRTHRGGTSMSVDPTEIEQQQLSDVSGQTVNLTQSSAVHVNGDRVELTQSIARMIDADAVEMNSSIAQIVEAETVRLSGSASLGARTETLAVEQSVLGLVRTTDATVADSAVLLLAGHEIQAANVNAFFVYADNAEGEVRALLDWRGAAVIGAVAGVVLFLLSLLGRSRRA